MSETANMRPNPRWTDLAGSVCAWYFESWFPAALRTIEELRARGGPSRGPLIHSDAAYYLEAREYCGWVITDEILLIAAI
jgi:hypothetical protein